MTFKQGPYLKPQQGMNIQNTRHGCNDITEGNKNLKKSTRVRMQKSKENEDTKRVLSSGLSSVAGFCSVLRVVN